MPRLLRNEQKAVLFGFLHERFGIPSSTFSDFDVFCFSRQAFLFRRQKGQMNWPEKAFVRCGLPFLRNVAGYLKPTTVFIQRFGKYARKNILELDLETLSHLCRKGEIAIEFLSESVEVPGYIIIKLQDYFLGAGLALEGDRLMCRFPKALRQAMGRL